MKLFLLERKDKKGGYDEYYGFVIAAKDSKSARKIAQENGADETRISYEEKKPFWTEAKKVSCKMIAGQSTFGKEQVVLSDFMAG